MTCKTSFPDKLLCSVMVLPVYLNRLLDVEGLPLFPPDVVRNVERNGGQKPGSVYIP